MCLYHSVAINIEIDILEVLDLNQIANFFLRKVLMFLLVACKNKGNKAHGS